MVTLVAGLGPLGGGNQVMGEGNVENQIGADGQFGFPVNPTLLFLFSSRLLLSLTFGNARPLELGHPEGLAVNEIFLFFVFKVFDAGVVLRGWRFVQFPGRNDIDCWSSAVHLFARSAMNVLHAAPSSFPGPFGSC